MYEVSGTRTPEGNTRWPHAGVHLVVVEPQTRRVLLRQRFLTYQPAEHLDMASTLASIQQGRLVILVAIVSDINTDILI